MTDRLVKWLTGVVVELSVDSGVGGRVSTLSTQSSIEDGLTLPRDGTLTCRVDSLPLNGGDYSWTLFALVDGYVADWISDVVPFTVDAASFYPTAHHPPLRGGPLLLRGAWEPD